MFSPVMLVCQTSLNCSRTYMAGQKAQRWHLEVQEGGLRSSCYSSTEDHLLSVCSCQWYREKEAAEYNDGPSNIFAWKVSLMGN